MNEDAFKDLVWFSIVKAALGRLFTLVPLLGWGPIGHVITFFAMKFGEQLFDAISKVVRIEILEFKNDETRKAFDSAAVKLKLTARSYGLESEQFKVARNEYQKKLSGFVMYDVSRDG